MSVSGCIALAAKGAEILFECTRLCQNIGDKKQRCFCRHLGAELLLLNGRLNDLSISDVSEKEINKVLEYLDMLCVWPSKSPSGQYQNLEMLVSSEGLATKENAQQGIIRLASSTHEVSTCHRKKFLWSLKSFCKEKDPGLSEVLEVVRHMSLEPVETKDYSYHINALYRALYAYRSCNNIDSDTESLAIKLRLNGYEEEEEALRFNLLFLPHPHSDSTDCPIEWQDTQLSVSLPRSQRRVGFEIHDEIQDYTPSLSEDPALEATDFCQLISNPQQSRLCIKVQNGRLVFEDFTDLIDTIVNQPSISLASLISGERLTYRMRCCLSTIVARAVWQFYDSEWMPRDWTKDQLHFPLYLRTNESMDPDIYVDKPFLSAKVGAALEQDINPPTGRIHKCPKILALGILLLEIELDVKIETKRLGKYLGPNGQLLLNTDYYTATTLFKNENWSCRDTHTPHKEVLWYCLDSSNFRRLTNTYDQREALHKNVVIPLERTFKNAWSGLDETPIRLSNRKGITEEVMPIMEPTVKSEIQSRPGRLRVNREAEAEAAKAWFINIEDMCSTLRKKRTVEGRVKIAILDTGLDERHSSFWAVKKGYEDFARNQNQRGIDNTGHGTNGFNLISKIMDDDVDIFVARIFEGEHATVNTPTLMARAIRHAISEWQVDIITISSGFEQDHSDLQKAVFEANAAHTLIFAAASNWGNREYIAFPARMHGNVMCIFSATADGKRSNFNPPRSRKSTTNFAVLGEQVEKVQIDLESHPGYDSGTSIATFIAAGIAALVIDFSRQEEGKKIIVDQERLKTVAGMKEIFAEMADGGDDGGYDGLVPQRVLECSKPDVRKRGLAARRAYIAETISRDLDKANKG